MTTYRYTVLLEKTEDGGYRAYCPAWTRCCAYGDTKKEAIRNIELSIHYRLDECTASGKPIPKDCDRAQASQ